jgi:hypothetical protein
MWHLWMTAQHVHGDTHQGLVAADGLEGPPPVPGAASSSAAAAAANTGRGYVDVSLSKVCKAMKKDALQAAASGVKWGLLCIGVLQAAVFASGTVLGLKALRCSYPVASNNSDCGFDPVGKWLQEQLQPGQLTRAGLLLMAAIVFVSLLGLPGILPRVAAFSLLHGFRSVWLSKALLLFAPACTTSVFLAVVAAAAHQVRMARQQQLNDIECQLRQLQQTKLTSTGEPGRAVGNLGSSSSNSSSCTTAGGLHDPLVSDDDGTCPLPPGTSPVLVAFDGASRRNGWLVGWLLVPMLWMSLALLLPVVVGTVALQQLLPAWLVVLQFPANLLLRGGRMRLLRLLHLLFATLVSPVIVVVAMHAPQLKGEFTWLLPFDERVSISSILPSLFSRSIGSSVGYYDNYDYGLDPQNLGLLAQLFTKGLEQGLLDQGLRPVIAALQVKPLLLLVLCALHVFVAMWELGWCTAALWLCLKHDGQPARSSQQGKGNGVDAAGACAGTSQMSKHSGRFLVARAMADLMMALAVLPLLLLWVLACGSEWLLFDSVFAQLCGVVTCCLACNMLCRWVVHVFMAALIGNSNKEYSPVMSDAAVDGVGNGTNNDAESSSSGGSGNGSGGGSRQSWFLGLAVDGFPHLVCKPVQQHQHKGTEKQHQQIDELADIVAAEAEAFSLPAFCKFAGSAVAVVVLSNAIVLFWYLVAYGRRVGLF